MGQNSSLYKKKSKRPSSGGKAQLPGRIGFRPGDRAKAMPSKSVKYQNVKPDTGIAEEIS